MKLPKSLHHAPRRRKLDHAARVDMNAALARAIAYLDVGKLDHAAAWGDRLIKLLHEHGMSSDA
jgi:hypothetical protein